MPFLIVPVMVVRRLMMSATPALAALGASNSAQIKMKAAIRLNENLLLILLLLSLRRP